MVRRIMVFLAAASAVSMLTLPLTPSGAYAASRGHAHSIAPRLLRQLEGSCWGCLRGALSRQAHTGAHRAASRHARHTVNRRAHTQSGHRLTHVVHRRTVRRLPSQIRRVAHPRRITVRHPARNPVAVLLNWGTRVLRGSMTSASTVRMTAAFSVGHAESLNWNLPRPTSLGLNGFQQQVRSIHFHFTVKPTSWTDTMVDNHPVRQFHWDNPPANTVIYAVEKLSVVTQSSLSPFHSSARYPLTSIPQTVQPYLGTTPLVQMPASAERLTRSLAAGKVREQRVVEAVVNWVASNVHYATGVSAAPLTASAVLQSRVAVCTGYADLTAGMLRSLGIPTQVVFGLVAGKPIDLQGPANAIGWGVGSSTGEMHAWLNVYFPDAGWVPVDPQLEKFFIDTRHIAFESNMDAGATGLGTWRAQAPAGASPTGHMLSNGNVAIAPADGISSQVAVQVQDSVHVQFDGSRPDVRHVLLFSR
ncbi:MAG TPA: transglutaminase domain-containing protein [Chloroflexota bacterium]